MFLNRQRSFAVLTLLSPKAPMLVVMEKLFQPSFLPTVESCKEYNNGLKNNHGLNQ
jgi:hypothetical protein